MRTAIGRIYCLALTVQPGSHSRVLWERLPVTAFSRRIVVLERHLSHPHGVKGAGDDKRMRGRHSHSVDVAIAR